MSQQTAHPDTLVALAKLSRACAAVEHALTSAAIAPEAWLTETTERLIELIGAQVAAHTWITSSTHLGPRPSVMHAAIAGMPSRDAADAALEAVRNGFPQDDVTRPEEPPRGAFPVRTSRRSQLIADALWRASGYRRWRSSIGLHEFARSTVALELAGSAGSLSMQLDGLSPDWNPCESTLAALSAYIPVIAREYERRFLAPQRARGALLDNLSEAQKLIAPLLAEGLTERQVAEALDRSVHTIHEHTREIYRALSVRNRMQLRDLWMAQLPRWPATGAAGTPQPTLRAHARPAASPRPSQPRR